MTLAQRRNLTMNAKSHRDVKPKVPTTLGGPCCPLLGDSVGSVETGIEHYARQHGAGKDHSARLLKAIGDFQQRQRRRLQGPPCDQHKKTLPLFHG